MNLQSIRGTAAGIARQAGMELLRHYQQPIAISTKSTATDIVTEADTAADAIIRAALQAAFPDDHIVTEESGGQGTAADTAERVWYVDPLDGTSNFASGFPFFSVSIGLVDRNGEPLVGVIYDPIRNEMFSAARGFGATANGRPLRVSATDSTTAPTPTTTTICGMHSCGGRARCAASDRQRWNWPMWPPGGWMANGKATCIPGTGPRAC